MLKKVSADIAALKAFDERLRWLSNYALHYEAGAA